MRCLQQVKADAALAGHAGADDLGAGRNCRASCAASSWAPRTTCPSRSTRCCCRRASARAWKRSGCATRSWSICTDVTALTDAAAAVEAGTFDAVHLDSRGRARPTRSASWPASSSAWYAKCNSARSGCEQQVQQLQIEIDERRKERQVAEITETDYFYQLQQKAADLRPRAKKG